MKKVETAERKLTPFKEEIHPKYMLLLFERTLKTPKNDIYVTKVRQAVLEI